jgi:hypothetical protein
MELLNFALGRLERVADDGANTFLVRPHIRVLMHCILSSTTMDLFISVLKPLQVLMLE